MRKGESAVPLENVTTREALGFILSYIKRHSVAVLAGVLVLVSVDAIQIVIPRVIQRIIDLLGTADFSYEIILQRTLVILALAVGMVVLRFFWRLFIIGSSWKIEREVREDMFSHLESLGFSFFNRTQTGNIMALMVNDLNAVRMATGLSFLAVTDALFMGSMSLILLLSINARLALFCVMPLPCIIFMITRFGPLIQSRFKRVQESFAGISSQAQEAFSGIRVVKGYVQEGHETEDFTSGCDEYVRRNVHLIKIWGFFFPAVTFFASLSMTILYLVGGRNVMTGSLTLGQFVSFSMYLGLLIWPVIATGWVISLLQRGIASAKRIMEVLRESSDIVDDPAPDAPRAIEGGVRFDDLSFRYEERYVLRHVDFDLPAGYSLGIMGKPGSGKSTLVSLLFRLFPLDEGRILIDGRPIEEYSLGFLRGSIGYVPQDPFLFSDTVRNNIGFGLDEGDPRRGRIEEYAALVDMHEEIEDFGEGYETLVGERGVTLSGGQKQRLSIARALIVEPRILVLDDALSSVDSETEKKVLAALRRTQTGRTAVYISHRVSTVAACDTILVLEEGRIVERGDHRQLLAREGYYARLSALQQMEESLAEGVGKNGLHGDERGGRGSA
jgi:ATP-binding cassette subfamily B multidrug efflux pump